MKSFLQGLVNSLRVKVFIIVLGFCFVLLLITTLVTSSSSEITTTDNNEVQASIQTTLATFAGYLATLFFTVQYIPQAWLNYKRRSVKGFSSIGIIIKLIGSSYLGVNSFLMGEALSVVLYGAFNILQHLIFIFQFTLFTNQRMYLLCILIPIIPLFCGHYYPESIQYSNLIKPLSQITSHIPQLIVTWQAQSTEGVSLASQHLNLFGGIAGIYMYSIFTPKSFFTRLVYWNSMLQAISLYVLAVYFDGWSRLYYSFFSFIDKPSTITNNDESNKKLQLSGQVIVGGVNDSLNNSLNNTTTARIINNDLEAPNGNGNGE
ncbi:hypothetical protein ABK040_009906 [Willaertia magna]